MYGGGSPGQGAAPREHRVDRCLDVSRVERSASPEEAVVDNTLDLVYDQVQITVRSEFTALAATVRAGLVTHSRRRPA